MTTSAKPVKQAKAWAIMRRGDFTYGPIMGRTRTEAVKKLVEALGRPWPVARGIGFSCVRVTVTVGWDR
jgi:hypothetical protein